MNLQFFASRAALTCKKLQVGRAMNLQKIASRTALTCPKWDSFLFGTGLFTPAGGVKKGPCSKWEPLSIGADDFEQYQRVVKNYSFCSNCSNLFQLKKGRKTVCNQRCSNCSNLFQLSPVSAPTAPPPYRGGGVGATGTSSVGTPSVGATGTPSGETA